ncbi:MAG: DinB family protein [Bacteroidota bacterium]
MRPLNEGEISDYFMTYANKVPKGDAIKLLKQTFKETRRLLKNVDEEKGNYAYADGKWTLKEVLIHIIDTEHVMGYRALRIARNDKTPLPGFDQNDFVRGVDVSKRSIKSLLKEFAAMRKLTIAMYRHFDDEMLSRVGTASNNAASAMAMLYVIIGHEIHHREVLIERYLS